MSSREKEKAENDVFWVFLSVLLMCGVSGLVSQIFFTKSSSKFMSSSGHGNSEVVCWHPLPPLIMFLWRIE